MEKLKLMSLGKRSVWIKNTLKKVMAHNDYGNNITAAECNSIDRWTPTDLIIREYLNNGGGSSKGFLGIERSLCIKAYDYICDNKELFIKADLISKDGYNNSGLPLWKNYDFVR